MGAKIDEKSIKKWSQDGKASWHRFLMDFGGFLEASWEGKWSQDRSKKASKKRWKNGRHQDGQKIEKRRSDDSRGEGSRALGRVPPFKAGQPPQVENACWSWPIPVSSCSIPVPVSFRICSGNDFSKYVRKCCFFFFQNSM